MHSYGPGGLHLPHRAYQVQGVTIACIGISQHRNCHCLTNHFDPCYLLTQCNEANIRHATTASNATTRDIDTLKTCLFNQEG